MVRLKSKLKKNLSVSLTKTLCEEKERVKPKPDLPYNIQII